MIYKKHIVRLVVITLTCLQIESTATIDFNFHKVFHSFASCVIHIVNFKPTYDVTTVDEPVILTQIHNETNIVLKSKVYKRKFLFCLVQLLLFPEELYQKHKYHSKIFDQGLYGSITRVLRLSGPIHKEQKAKKKLDGALIEEQVILILSTKQQKYWLKRIGDDRTVHVARCFIFQTYHRRDNNVLGSITDKILIRNINFICSVCSKSRLIAVQLFPSLIWETEICTENISFCLDMFDSHITGKHSRFFLIIGEYSKESQKNGVDEYPHHVIKSKMMNKLSLSPFQAIKNISRGYKGFQELIEIILFQALEYTNHCVFDSIPASFLTTGIPLHELRHFSRFRPKILYQDTRINNDWFTRAFIPTVKESFNFITCNGYKTHENTGIHITQFVSPYSSRVWILMGLISVITTCFLCLLLHGTFSNFKFQKKVTRSKHMDLKISVNFSVEIIGSSLLENGIDFNFSTNNQISYKTTVYFLLSGWLLGVFLFNNTYRGVLTSDIFQLEETINRSLFCELEINFSIVTPTSYEHEKEFVNQNKTELPMSKSSFGSAVFKESFSEGLTKAINSSIGSVRLRKMFRRSVALKWDNFSGFYNFISDCSLTAVVEVTDRIDFYLHKLNSLTEHHNKIHKRKRFAKGKDSYLAGTFGYMFHGYSVNRMGHVYKCLQHLIQSGIYNLFYKWIYTGSFNFPKQADIHPSCFNEMGTRFIYFKLICYGNCCD